MDHNLMTKVKVVGQDRKPTSGRRTPSSRMDLGPGRAKYRATQSRCSLIPGGQIPSGPFPGGQILVEPNPGQIKSQWPNPGAVAPKRPKGDHRRRRTRRRRPNHKKKIEEQSRNHSIPTIEATPTKIELLKKKLVDLFYGTDRGLRATSEMRVEIVELITKLEVKNPTPAPTEALTLLNGKWILA
ncbi:hypothetical protein Vadar_030509 [Vaccinium darrowii]|uniref:Uncharacterized protein n=1 Tax=Vaccinium darrowii TaxID=229202 RepID=A0ACB7YIC0_9ERIC|nr:hypothetical protein Vadar_030509 [Vaccinium darrowii]